MPAVCPQKLKKLMISELLAPFAMKRRLSGAQLDDLVHRAMGCKEFDLSASSDTFVNFTMDQAEASQWAEEFEHSNVAPHIFASAEHNSGVVEELYGGMRKSDFLKLPPETRLTIANRVEGERAAKKH